MKNTSFKIEDVVGDIFNKESNSPEQTTTLNNVLVKML